MNDEVARLQLALCLAERECQENFPGNHPQSCVCHGTDIVPLLEGVREKCPCLVTGPEDEYHCILCGWDKGEFIHDPDCEPCSGRGWVPSTDPWKWFEATYEVFTANRNRLAHITRLDRMASHIYLGELAFYTALAKALGVKEGGMMNTKCPKCGSTSWLEGPHGGGAVNLQCEGCGYCVNYAPGFGMVEELGYAPKEVCHKMLQLDKEAQIYEMLTILRRFPPLEEKRIAEALYAAGLRFLPERPKVLTDKQLEFWAGSFKGRLNISGVRLFEKVEGAAQAQRDYDWEQMKRHYEVKDA